ncbi:DUF488 domain-containing protein [Catenuloplanes nepalensis]|uniref:DUF488 domain-containing protein n=1 Tax=Catenuloplanes nepalensis TaxID=587533 RepID=UPI0035205DA8
MRVIQRGDLTPRCRRPVPSGRSALNNPLCPGGYCLIALASIPDEHCRELGNPKANRAGFGSTEEEVCAARAVYAGLLCGDTAAHALDELALVATRDLVALLCFESDQSRCHRGVLLRNVGG